MIDKAELAAELEKNPEIQKLAVDTLATKAKYTIRDEAGQKVYEENFRKDVLEKTLPGELSKKIEEVHSRYDKDFTELFGEAYKRNTDEKTYDALKRVGKATLDAKANKIAQLEDQIKKGDPTGAIAKQLEEAQNTYQVELKKANDKIKALESEGANTSKTITLNNLFAEVSKKFVKNLPAMFDQTKKYVLDDALNNSILKDGVLYLKDAAGGIKKDSNFNDVKLEDYLKAQFKDVIDTKIPPSGAGSKGAPAGGGVDPSTITKETFVRGDNVKTPTDLMTQLIASGVVRGSKVFNEIWSAHVDTSKNALKTVG